MNYRSSASTTVLQHTSYCSKRLAARASEDDGPIGDKDEESDELGVLLKFYT